MGKGYLINENIKFPEVLLIMNDGTNLGKIDTEKALEIAKSKSLDLVLLASTNGDIPTCKIMNYRKVLYEKKKRVQQNKKTQKIGAVKAVRFGVNIGENDYLRKVEKVKSMVIKEGHRVEVVVFFRRHEMRNFAANKKFFDKLRDDLAEELKVDKEFSGDATKRTWVVVVCAKI